MMLKGDTAKEFLSVLICILLFVCLQHCGYKTAFLKIFIPFPEFCHVSSWQIVTEAPCPTGVPWAAPREVQVTLQTTTG